MSDEGKTIVIILIMAILAAWIMFYPIPQLSEISIRTRGFIALIVNLIIYAIINVST